MLFTLSKDTYCCFNYRWLNSGFEFRIKTDAAHCQLRERAGLWHILSFDLSRLSRLFYLDKFNNFAVFVFEFW